MFFAGDSAYKWIQWFMPTRIFWLVVDPPIPNIFVNRNPCPKYGWKDLNKDMCEPPIAGTSHWCSLMLIGAPFLMVKWKFALDFQSLSIWRFPEMVVPLVLIHVIFGFSSLNHPFGGTTMGSLKSAGF